MCLEHHALPVLWERGVGAGGRGEGGVEVPVCRRGPGLPGGSEAAAAHPQRHLRDPVSAFVRALQKWGAGGLCSQGPGAWGARLARGKLLWALGTGGRAGADAAELELLCHRGRGRCCQGDWHVSHAPSGAATGCRGQGPGLWGQDGVPGASPSSALGSRDQRPHPAPEAWAVTPLGGPSSPPALL